ncbi:MAG: 50S ribosomal protein L9 [Actinomycetota bacterium]
MKIILQKPVEKLGDPGDVVEVADGYARNFLIPRSLAVRAHKGAAQQAENLRRAHERRQYARKGEFEAVASKLISGGPIRVTARAGDEGKLFGSVTAENIVDAIAVQHDGVTVDRRDVHLEEPIRSIGAHEVRVHLFHQVDPVVTVEVVPES